MAIRRRGFMSGSIRTSVSLKPILGADVDIIVVTNFDRTLTRALHAFAWLAILTPKRIWNEDVGDALETIAGMQRGGCSKLHIRAKIVSTYFWVLVAVLRELIAALTGRKSPHK